MTHIENQHGARLTNNQHGWYFSFARGYQWARRETAQKHAPAVRAALQPGEQAFLVTNHDNGTQTRTPI
jgi:predicted P-loop ATPase